MRVGCVNLKRTLAWDPRDELVIEEVNSMDLDWCGFQETTEEMEDDLAVRLAGPWMVVSDHVNCPILARSDRFERVKWNGKNYITIEMPGSVRKRYGSATLLKRLSDGLVFVAVSAHPSNNGESSNAASDRLRQGQSLVDHLKDWGVLGKFPVFVVMDSNDKSGPTKGLPGVMVRNGFIDVTSKLGIPIDIDRAFVIGFKVTEAKENKVIARVSDHHFWLFVGEPTGTIPDEPTTPPKTELEKLEAKHGPITVFKVASFEKARKGKTKSRYVAWVQKVLGREVTTLWSESDQKAYDVWRHEQFPTWEPFEYKGPMGLTSARRLGEVAKAKGLPDIPVVAK